MDLSAFTTRSPINDTTGDESALRSTGLDWKTNMEMQKMMVKAFSPYNLPVGAFKKRHKSVPFKGHVNMAYVTQDLESSLMMTSGFNDVRDSEDIPSPIKRSEPSKSPSAIKVFPSIRGAMKQGMNQTFQQEPISSFAKSVKFSR